MNAPPLRLIPAHAGKTSASSATTAMIAAHPRSRGENEVSKSSNAFEVGSSPLTRGKRSSCVHAQADQGLIPAHAGKTWSTGGMSSPTAAHPRSRGENVQVTGAALDPKGSSPLTRGKHEHE